jgi:2-C-methyl-D-erythritol 4-phosphate cytidylyltransferase
MTGVTLLASSVVPGARQVWTIIVAGGAGRRFGSPKQYELVGGRRILDRSRDVAEAVSDGVVVVVPPDDVEREGGVAGGKSRSDSVRAGLDAVPAEATIICVHDAARPFATTDLYGRVIEAIRDGVSGAIPGVAVADTIKVVEGDVVVSTPDRATLVAVQTPQAFDARALRAAHAAGGDATDDAALVEAQGGTIVVVAGEPMNRKVTVPDDLEWARRVAVVGE